jgi:hypothetical protein
MMMWSLDGPWRFADETAPTVDDLKAERERLDELIARAERDGVAR